MKRKPSRRSPQTPLEATRGSSDRPDDIVKGLGDNDVEFEAKVTGYSSSLLRIGTHDDYLGWIRLIGETGVPVAYIYLRRPLQPPRISFKKEYVVLDWLPEQLEALLSVLGGNEPLRIRYSGSEDEGWAFIERR